MRIWAGGTVHKNTYPESSQCQETGKHRLNLTYNSSSAFMLKLVYCERHKLTTVFSGMIYNPIPDLKFLFIPFLSSRGSYTEEVYHMRCPKKRRGALFLLQPASPLCAPAGASQVPLPGARLTTPVLPLLLPSSSWIRDLWSTGIPYLHKCSYLSCWSTDTPPSISHRGGFSGRNVSSSGAPGVSCSGVCFSCGDSPPQGHSLSWQPTTLGRDRCLPEHVAKDTSLSIPGDMGLGLLGLYHSRLLSLPNLFLVPPLHRCGAQWAQCSESLSRESNLGWLLPISVSSWDYGASPMTQL